MSVEVAPPYAILSHTWEDRETSFKEFKKTPRPDSVTSKPGFWKISRFCEKVANTSPVNYAWADTCCIDKKSSAELSEAINSMYAWYARADLCIVYMQAVKLDSAGFLFDHKRTFRRSRWFTRGWTLQELLAPRGKVSFYDTSWEFIGTRGTLKKFISEATAIDEKYLDGTLDPSQVSVATRMSWAASRSTTRVEDIAYSLLGLFDVNMPLLYGEGPKAFRRLQIEIIRISTDQSIFAWCKDDSAPERHGILADSPADFLRSGGVIAWKMEGRKPYSITNLGLQIDLPYYADHNRALNQAQLLVKLACSILDDEGAVIGPVKIILMAESVSIYKLAYVLSDIRRCACGSIEAWDRNRTAIPGAGDVHQLLIEL